MAEEWLGTPGTPGEVTPPISIAGGESGTTHPDMPPRLTTWARVTFPGIRLEAL